MDQYQAEVARIALAAAARFGFVIAGGNAISLHGIGGRPSDDVDLFTDNADATEFGRAVEAVVQAVNGAGWETEVTPQWGTYVRLVATKGDATVRLDLSQDYRSEPPAMMMIGPVLSMRDAVASKMATLFSRGEVRDYLDVAAIINSGHFTRDELLALGDQIEAAPLDRRMLVDRFRAVDRIADSEFRRYRVADRAIRLTRTLFQHWADLLSLELLPPPTAERPRHDRAPERDF